MVSAASSASAAAAADGMEQKKDRSMANDIDALSRLLAHNPFDNDVRSEWRNKLENSRSANYDELCQRQYILPFDANNPQFMDLVRRGRANNDPDRIRTEFLPLPFCGNPKADIWYIQINPRGNDVDLYDFFSICPLLKDRIKDELSRQTSLNVTDFTFCKTGEEEERALVDRQSLLIGQLDLLKEQHEFYPLNSAFKTIEHRGRKLIGSWEWWRSAFCINNRDSLFYRIFAENEENAISSIIGQELFVLEWFPYASERQHTWQCETIYPTNHPYKRFVVDMLEYAVRNEKSIVFRSRRGFDAMGLEEIVPTPIFMRNPSRVRLTHSNLEWINRTMI